MELKVARRFDERVVDRAIRGEVEGDVSSGRGAIVILLRRRQELERER